MITKAQLIKLLQDSDAPDDAIVDISMPDRDRRLEHSEPFWTHIYNGPNAGDWLTFELED